MEYTITHEQFDRLLSVARSLAAKYRLDKPVDYGEEAAILAEVLREIQNSFDPEP